MAQRPASSAMLRLLSRSSDEPDLDSERVTRHAYATMQAWAIIYNPDTFSEEVCISLGRRSGHP